MKIIGRRSEIRELKQCDRSKKSELVCVYGRRRVGKTFLVEQTFSGSFAFRATGVENGNTRQQLKSFNQRLIEHGDTVKTIPKDWFEAFSRLDKVLSKEEVTLSPNGKRIVFFDEFPWFATPRSDFLMAFGEFWNRRGTEKGDFVFIICGSATSWIMQNVLENTGSMYNRVTCQIYLEPFSLRETEQFFIDREFGWSREQIAECQMVFGGLPFFMELLDRDDSLRQNVDRLLFGQGALLRDESKRLLEATLKKSPVYEKVLSLLARNKYGMLRSECQKTLKLADSTFSRAISDLVKCGYVSENKRKDKRGNPFYIQLIDPFLLFHYSFVSNNIIDSYTELAQSEGAFSNWRGHAFEILCLQHVEQIKKALGISGVKTSHFPWESTRNKGGAQIDLVIERDDGITDLCEMKYTDKPYSMSKEYDMKLIEKRDMFREETGTKKALKTVLVTANGISGTTHTENLAAVITLDDLFE